MQFKVLIVPTIEFEFGIPHLELVLGSRESGCQDRDVTWLPGALHTPNRNANAQLNPRESAVEKAAESGYV